MTDVADFLRARYADAVREQQDESTAWHAPNCESVPSRWRSEIGSCDCGVPARVIAEVEARRRVLGRHAIDPTEVGDFLWRNACKGCGSTGDYGDPVTQDINDCPELCDAAAVYADHADYRQEWRPS